MMVSHTVIHHPSIDSCSTLFFYINIRDILILVGIRLQTSSQYDQINCRLGISSFSPHNHVCFWFVVLVEMCLMQWFFQISHLMVHYSIYCPRCKFPSSHEYQSEPDLNVKSHKWNPSEATLKTSKQGKKIFIFNIATNKDLLTHDFLLQLPSTFRTKKEYADKVELNHWMAPDVCRWMK